MNPLVFVVDDHGPSAQALADVLRDEGYDVKTFSSGAEALALFGQETPDVLVTDLRMDGMDGVELLRQVRLVDAELPVIVVTAYATIDRAVEATRAGAFAFVTKPLRPGEILVQVRNAAAQRTLTKRIAGDGSPRIVGRSVALLRALGMADRAARTDLSVLITGESGTGKELLARRIHEGSARGPKAFVAINCGAIAETLLDAELFGAAKGAYTGSDRDRPGLVEAADGAEALAIIESHPTPIDAVLTDLRMPGMSGEELVTALQRRSPRLPVLAMTGHGDSGALAGSVKVLMKPFEPRDVIGAVIDAVVKGRAARGSSERGSRKTDGRALPNGGPA